jgi:transcription termination factor NusB
MKKVFILSLVTIVAFAAGWYGSLVFYSRVFCVSELKKSCAEIAVLQANIESLDRKDFEPIRTRTNLDIDGKIILINSMLETSKNKEDTERAKKLLSRVAKHRKQFPSEFPANLQNLKTAELHSTVDAILAKYADYK